MGEPMSDAGIVAVVIAVAAVIAIALWYVLMKRGSAERATPAMAMAARPAAAAPVVADVAPIATTGALEVRAIHHGEDGSGEWVQIANIGYAAVQLAGWRLTDEGAKHAYTFPAIVVEPDRAIRVHMWDGADDANDLYIGRRQRWWNNAGDTAYLYDAEGTLVHAHSYGSAAGSN